MAPVAASRRSRPPSVRDPERRPGVGERRHANVAQPPRLHCGCGFNRLAGRDIYEAAGVFRHVGEAIAGAEGQTEVRWQLLSVSSGRSQTVPQAARRLGLTRQTALAQVCDHVDIILLALYHATDVSGK
jgi:hypothetical protein